MRTTGITPLKARRMVRGLTLRDVADATGLQMQALKEWELAMRRPPPGALEALARHYGASVDELSRFPDLSASRLSEEEVDRLAAGLARRLQGD